MAKDTWSRFSTRRWLRTAGAILVVAAASVVLAWMQPRGSPPTSQHRSAASSSQQAAGAATPSAQTTATTAPTSAVTVVENATPPAIDSALLDSHQISIEVPPEPHANPRVSPEIARTSGVSNGGTAPISSNVWLAWVQWVSSGVSSHCLCWVVEGRSATADVYSFVDAMTGERVLVLPARTPN